MTAISETDQPGLPVKRPALITLLVVLHVIGAALLLPMGTSELWGFPLGRGKRSMFDREFGILAILFAIVALACGVGLWRLKPYGRRLQIGLAVTWLILFPIGTAIGAAVLIYMWTPAIRALFSGKSASDFTPAERAKIAKTAGPGGATVAIGTIVLIVAGAVIGTAYFVTKPARVKAAIAANEASAIVSMRSILSAEVSYAAAAGGGYATSLHRLSIPCKGMSQGFISDDLGKDPSKLNGYTFRLESVGAGEVAVDCHGAATEADFYATADPMNYETGKRAFSASAAGVLYEAPELPPSAFKTIGGTATPVK